MKGIILHGGYGTRLRPLTHTGPKQLIPVEIREELGIREGEEVEWALEGQVIVVRPVREEKSPDEIMEHIKNHLVKIKSATSKAASTDMKRRMLDEWARRKLGLRRDRRWNLSGWAV